MELSAELYMGGPKDSIVTEYRVADRCRSELVQVGEPACGDCTL